MRVLLAYCHPREDSFCAALRDTAVSTLEAARHTVEVRDLYAEGFAPALSAEEREAITTRARTGKALRITWPPCVRPRRCC